MRLRKFKIYLKIAAVTVFIGYIYQSFNPEDDFLKCLIFGYVFNKWLDSPEKQSPGEVKKKIQEESFF